MLRQTIKRAWRGHLWAHSPLHAHLVLHTSLVCCSMALNESTSSQGRAMHAAPSKYPHAAVYECGCPLPRSPRQALPRRQLAQPDRGLVCTTRRECDEGGGGVPLVHLQEAEGGAPVL